MIPAITIRDPWLTCITLGAKTVENRGQRFRLRGLVAIHAGKFTSDVGYADPRVIQTLGPNPRPHPGRGAIVAVADLSDCHEAEQYADGGTCCAQSWGDRTYNGAPAWHLVLRDVMVLRWPVRCRGAVQIGWKLTEDVERRVRSQMVLAVTP